jgi:target of rapamycin complex 2 subunit MAPKAP1
VIHEKIHKRLDKLVLPGPNVPSTATSATTGSAVGSVSASSYLGPSAGYGPQILLRIRIAEHADSVHVSTTIPVYVHRLFFC